MTVLESIRDRRPQGTPRPQRLERQVSKGAATYLSRLTSRTSCSNQCWAVVEELLEVQWGQMWELKTSGELSYSYPLPPILCDLLPGASPGTQSKYWRKIPLCFWQGEENRNHFETGQSILFFFIFKKYLRVSMRVGVCTCACAQGRVVGDGGAGAEWENPSSRIPTEQGLWAQDLKPRVRCPIDWATQVAQEHSVPKRAALKETSSPEPN